MKKITLAILAVTALAFSSVAQSNYNVVAPPNVGATSSLRAPNGTADHAYQRTVMFINHEELVPMNIATFTSIAFQYLNGTGSTPVAGTMTLMLLNATDFQYSLGGTYNTAITGMSTVFVGPYTVPAASGSATVPLTLGTPFNYTGGGLYVAWDFESTGPFATTAASLASCNQFNNEFDNTTNLQSYTWLGSADATVTPVPTALGGSLFRPSLIFQGTNNATNEVELLSINALGKTCKLFGVPEVITTRVVNSSIGAQSNLTVAINITGANPFVATQVIPSLAAGATTMLTWNTYAPASSGISTITAAVLLADQNPANNTLSWRQEANCTSVANIYPNAPLASGYGWNAANGGIFANKYTIPTNCLLSTISMPTWTSSSATAPMFGVLIDVATNNILASSSNTPSGIPGATMVFNFNPPINLTANTDYYFGVATNPSSATSFAYAYSANDVFVCAPVYQFALGAGSAPGLLGDNLYMGIEAGLTFTNNTIIASASKTLVCKNQPVLLTASGVDTYTWTGGVNTSTLAVTSPSTATPAVKNYTVAGTNTLTGCKTAVAAITLSIQNTCNFLGLGSNGAIETEISVFPNPSKTGIVNVQGLIGTNRVQVMNMLGQSIIDINTEEENLIIDLKDQAAGSYLVKIVNSDSQSKMIKVVKAD